ncbi:MAG: hypothetical protein V1875_05805 [Candidatus Altiarchaeota archaeon]
MKKTLMILFMLTLAVSAAELAWIQSSPIIGEGNLADMTDASGRSLLDRMGGFDQMPGIYGAYYDRRPHRADPYAGIYKITLSGLEGVQEQSVGVFLWRSGIMRQCRQDTSERTREEALESVHAYRPTAAASQFLPLSGMEGFEMPSLNVTMWGGRPGKAYVWRDLGWLRLGDLSAGNAVFLFTDGCGVYNNMSGEEFLQEVADSFRVDFARTAFAESVMDGSSFEGILYMAYYPSYNGTWIVTYNIPEDEVNGARVSVDGAQMERNVIYPFILAKGWIPDGKHRLVLSTKKKEYALDFATETSPLNIEPLMTNMSDDGRLHVELTHLYNEVTLNTAEATLDGVTKAYFLGNRTLEPYENGIVDIDFGREVAYDEPHSLDVRISYDIRGENRWLNRTLM